MPIIQNHLNMLTYSGKIVGKVPLMSVVRFPVVLILDGSKCDEQMGYEIG